MLVIMINEVNEGIFKSILRAFASIGRYFINNFYGPSDYGQQTPNNTTQFPQEAPNAPIHPIAQSRITGNEHPRNLMNAFNDVADENPV